MPDIELLSILRITYDIIGWLHDSRKLYSQTVKTSDSLNCRTNKAPQIKIDKKVMLDGERNISDYFRCITTRAADKTASEVLTNEIDNEFSEAFIRSIHWGLMLNDIIPRLRGVKNT